MLTVAFGEFTTSRTQVQLWYNRFKEGREGGYDDAGTESVNNNNENIQTVKKMILDNRWFSIERLLMMLLVNVGISFGSCPVIFKNVLSMKSLAAKFVTKLQNFEQKQRRMDISSAFLKLLIPKLNVTDIYAIILLYCVL